MGNTNSITGHYINFNREVIKTTFTFKDGKYYRNNRDNKYGKIMLALDSWIPFKQDENGLWYTTHKPVELSFDLVFNPTICYIEVSIETSKIKGAKYQVFDENPHIVKFKKYWRSKGGFYEWAYKKIKYISPKLNGYTERYYRFREDNILLRYKDKVYTSLNDNIIVEKNCLKRFYPSGNLRAFCLLKNYAFIIGDIFIFKDQSPLELEKIYLLYIKSEQKQQLIEDIRRQYFEPNKRLEDYITLAKKVIRIGIKKMHINAFSFYL